MALKNTIQSAVQEPARSTPVVSNTGVLVAGGGPAGFAAAISAARCGAPTTLVETHGQLGGVWTTGLLSWIIDHENKAGIMSELLGRLESVGGRARQSDGTMTSAYDAEVMKLVLEQMCLEAGVTLRLHTRVVAALADADRRLTHIVTESRSGREAWAASTFVDATGDGDLAAQAGCGFDLGDPESGKTMPMTLMMLLTGITAEEVLPFINGEGGPWGVPQRALREAIQHGGNSPSYDKPTLFRIHDSLFALMANHQYDERPDDAQGLTRATLRARAEIHAIVNGLRGLGGPWRNVSIVATGAQIGVREARRVHGRYTVSLDDMKRGARFPDAVCRATFCVDVHPPDKARGGVSNEGQHTLPYDIPLRSLIARDVEGLLLAGRCISGDYLAHSSYRVTGNAVALGEAAGVCAALAAARRCKPSEVPADEVRTRLPQLPE